MIVSLTVYTIDGFHSLKRIGFCNRINTVNCIVDKNFSLSSLLAIAVLLEHHYANFCCIFTDLHYEVVARGNDT